MPLDRNQKPVTRNQKIQNIIKQALKEDIGRGDITTNLLIPEYLKIKAIILAKEKGVMAGVDVARLVFKSFDRHIKFKSRVKDGELVRTNTLIANLEGPAKGILTAERTALNFLSRLSGIATQTHKFVEAVNRWKIKIMDTRKTTPNLRILEKYAVRMGGGHNHRIGLFDMVLIKDNHIKTRNQPAPTIVTSRSGKPETRNQKLKIRNLIQEVKEKAHRGMKIEIEARNLKEFKEALKARPDIIMLDNMNLRDIKKAVKIRNEFHLPPSTFHLPPKLEVSGRVTLKNIREIAKTGLEMVSIGSLTHSVESLDVSLEVIE